MTKAHFVTDVLQDNTGDLCIYLHKRLKKNLHYVKPPLREWKAKTVDPKIMLGLKYVTPCTPFRLVPKNSRSAALAKRIVALGTRFFWLWSESVLLVLTKRKADSGDEKTI